MLNNHHLILICLLIFFNRSPIFCFIFPLLMLFPSTSEQFYEYLREQGVSKLPCSDASILKDQFYSSEFLCVMTKGTALLISSTSHGWDIHILRHQCCFRLYIYQFYLSSRWVFVPMLLYSKLNILGHWCYCFLNI